MKEIILKTYVRQFGEDELSGIYRMLVQAALKTAETAYAPYSHFRVGAAALLANGEVVCGSNQENAAYPSGLCAERVALFYAGARYPGVAVDVLAIAALAAGKQVSHISPCGACRQVMLETEMRNKKPLTILLCNADGVVVVESSKELLPLSFDGEELP